MKRRVASLLCTRSRKSARWILRDASCPDCWIKSSKPVQGANHTAALLSSQKRNFLQFCGQTRQGIVETGYVQAKTASGQQWRKWIGAAAMEWKKIKGGTPLHETYILDTQRKTDPRENSRFLLSHGKLSCFWVCGKAWTFSGTVSVYPQWDDNKDLVEILRGKFKEAEGAS